MQQRIVLRLMACFGLLIPVGMAAASAQGSDPAPTNADLPTVLLVMERPPASPPQQIDLNTRLKATLREALNRSGHFQVHSFIPGESIIKRALNEHLIAADDLAEPHKAESLQRIAKAIGARSILRFGVTLDHVGARTEMKYMDNPNVADWLVLADERMAVPFVIGRKHLKVDDIVNLTVDSIMARIGIPTHLAGNLQIMPGSRVFGADDSNGKKPANGRAAKNAPKAPATDNSTANDIASTDRPNTVSTVPKQGPAAKSGKAARGQSAARPDPIKPETLQAQATPVPRPLFTNEADPAHDALPAQPAVAPAPAVARPDYEAQALRYRQTGDLSNAIQALRRVVNERPRDVGVRRQLIQAYQLRQMPEAAHAEALRALQMDANSAPLYRLYGEVLMAQGDMTGAMRAFRDGTRIDPADIGCQVALGDALLAENHYVQALEAYDAASKVDAKSPLPHRRIARALVARAGSDNEQYPASLAEIRRAQELTPPTDNTSYVEDYVSIMHIVEGRIRDMLEELQSANQDRVQAKRKETELIRLIADMKQRGVALSDYLDKLPAAAGHNVTQAHYTQANALLLQAVEFFKDVVSKGDDRFVEAMKSGQVQAQRELTVASQRLNSAKSADKSKDS